MCALVFPYGSFPVIFAYVPLEYNCTHPLANCLVRVCAQWAAGHGASVKLTHETRVPRAAGLAVSLNNRFFVYSGGALRAHPVSWLCFCTRAFVVRPSCSLSLHFSFGSSVVPDLVLTP
jgi:hypothetical protein